MSEYLISNADGTGWPAIHADGLAHALAPAGWASEQIPGWGDHRLRVGTAEVVFSGEEPGWQVVIEGTVPPPGEAALIEVIADQIAKAAGNEVKITALWPRHSSANEATLLSLEPALPRRLDCLPIPETIH